MALKRSVFHSSRPASEGKRSAHNVHSLVVPSFSRAPSALQHVPENTEMEFKAPPVPAPRKIFRSEDWNSLEAAIIEFFEGEDPLSRPGELYRLHQNVKNILKSKTGTFLSDYYKQELLSKGMQILTDRLKNVRGLRLLLRMEEIWNYFYTKILPALESILYLVKPKTRLTIRTATLTAFRDLVVFSVDFKSVVKSAVINNKDISATIKQMLLVLQSVNDCYPPSRTKLLLESTAALVISPYLGYLGLYEGSEILTVESNEPKLASRRRSSVDIGGLRRISRPFSIQPVQMETLNQMFLNAIRKKQETG